MIRFLFATACLLTLASCAAPGGGPILASLGGPRLISGQSPAAAMARNSEPEPPNSLPPGALGLGGGINATAPDYGAITLSTGH